MEAESNQQGVGRPRSMASREAILESALQLTLKNGFAALTIEGISKEARVGKPTIYRWWPSKGAIVLEALTQRAANILPLPSKGLSLSRRVESFLQELFRVLNGELGAVVKGLMGEAQLDPEFATLFREKFVAVRRQPVLTMLREGQAQGELSPDSDIELLGDLLYGAIWYRLLVQHAPLDGKFAREIVRVVLKKDQRGENQGPHLAAREKGKGSDDNPSGPSEPSRR
jgi:AcrR family transcriptional regulator